MIEALTTRCVHRAHTLGPRDATPLTHTSPRTLGPPRLQACVRSPGRLPQTDWTGPGPDPRKIASITSINSPTCDRMDFDSERTLSRPNAHKPAGYLAAAATRGCKRALLALSGPLPLASARCDACFSHSHLRPSPRRDGLHSDAAVPNPCALVDRWRAATLQPARRPCCSALVIPLRTPFARRSPFVLHGLAVAEHGSLLTAFSLGGPSPRRRSFITCGRWHRGTSPRCVLSALPSWQCAVCTAAAALPRSRTTVMLGLVSQAVLTFITCAGVTFAPATHARKTIAPIGGFYLNYSRYPASRTEDRHGSSTGFQRG